jgi:predicted metal-binding membrane protein
MRSVLWLVFFTAILAAWSVMYSMSIGMGLDLIGRPGPMAEVMRNMDPTMDMHMPMAEFGPLFWMWAIMMAAMMLPTMVPTLSSYEDLIRSANGSQAGWLGVLLGYGMVWLAFAAVITTLQLVLLRTGVIDMLGIARTTLVSGCLLIAVGAFQFTHIKETCQGACQSPISYFLSRWKTGFVGGVRMGLGLGAFCVGCCWGFMPLGFVGGVMSLLWMGLATVFMVLEKLPQIGHRVTRPLGVTLILGGIGLLASAHIYEG